MEKISQKGHNLEKPSKKNILDTPLTEYQPWNGSDFDTKNFK